MANKKPTYEQLKYYYDTSVGLWCTDFDPNEFDSKTVQENAFQLKPIDPNEPVAKKEITEDIQRLEKILNDTKNQEFVNSSHHKMLQAELEVSSKQEFLDKIAKYVDEELPKGFVSLWLTFKGHAAFGRIKQTREEFAEAVKKNISKRKKELEG